MSLDSIVHESGVRILSKNKSNEPKLNHHINFHVSLKQFSAIYTNFDDERWSIILVAI